MAKQREKVALSKTNWTQQFTIVGKAVVNDYTFKLDEHSNKSDWIYNQLNLNVDCGEHSGKVSCELMGGYGSERANNVIYVHGKNEDNSDDFKNNSQDEHREDIISELKKWQNWAQRLQSAASDYYYTFDLNDLNETT